MTAPSGGEHVYATLLLSDSYLPGALVLAHSLRDAGTTKKLAVLVTIDSVTADAITQLKAVYDYVLPVPRIRNEKPANLYLMNRADLHSAFTKINLWKQTQFSRIVYIDADIVAYRAPDELFDLPHAFAAASDIGWPDIFNTGVMALTPNMGDFYALRAMAERGVSFDGADQGLFNMYFQDNFHRLPFTYNVTPSAHYQYLPAYRHFQSSINLVHFIGTNKPWLAGRHASYGGSAYDEMVGRWWAVHDRHYREQESSPSRQHHHHAGGASSHGMTIQSWDAQKQPPPSDSKPEAMNFPSTHYEMSMNAAPFVPPERYPSPPRNVWYDIPKEPPAPRPIFPWEGHQPRPSRSFIKGEAVSVGPSSERTTESQPPAELPALESPTADTKSEPTTPSVAKVVHASPWTAFPRTNAWDEVAGINRYIEGFEKHRRTKSRSSKGGLGPLGNVQDNVQDDLQDGIQAAIQDGVQLRGLKLTDFPSEAERPSLPVTPAPVRRPSLWGQGDEPEAGDGDQPLLPTAEGVPAQSEWDPTAQLQKLADQQSEELLRRLGGEEDGLSGAVSCELSHQTLPCELGLLENHTHHVAQSVPSVLSPQPVKGAAAVTTTSLERKMDRGDINAGEDTDTTAATMQQPSYSGPGVAWDKGEAEVPQHETPLPPSEEDRDVLDT